MKTLSLFILLILLVTQPLLAQKIRIKGSDTMLPLTQMLAEEFMRRNIDASVTITGGGSLTGITALLNGTTDIAESARELSVDEKQKLKKANLQITESIVAYDALAVIVNHANTVNQLTLNQLEAIFSGTTTNWKDVGGADAPIVVYSRSPGSGTYDFFKEHVLNGKKYVSTAQLMPATGAIAQSVSQEVNAIGYVGLAYVDKTLKPIEVSGDNGKTFISPSIETVKNKSYPISRPLYFIYPDNLKSAVSPFIEFVLSATGQKLVVKTGYVPVK